MAQMTIDIAIGADGQVKADVLDGQGQACITSLLAGLEELLGQADVTKTKPEFAWDTEAIALLKSQRVTA